MKPILTSFIISLIIFSCANKKQKDDLYIVRQPAEFESQHAIWLIWPSTNHKQGESVEKVTLSIIEALIATEKIVVTCRDSALLANAKEILLVCELVYNKSNLFLIEERSH